MEVCCFLRHDINFMPAKGEKSFMRQLREKRLLSFSILSARTARKGLKLIFCQKTSIKQVCAVSAKRLIAFLTFLGSHSQKTPQSCVHFSPPDALFTFALFQL